MKYLASHKLKIILLAVNVLLIIGLLTGCTATIPHGWAGVAIAGNNLYIGSLNGTLVGLDANTRSRLFNDLLLETQVSGGFLGCAAATASVFIYGTPVVATDLGMVFVAGYNGKIYAVSADKGVQQWTYPRQGALTPFVGGLTLYQDKLYIGGNDGKVYAIDAKTGDPLWTNPFTTGNKVWATPTASDNTLYIGSYDKKLYAINLSDGSEKWHFETEGAIMNAPILQNGVLYFGSFDRYFYAVDANNGNLIWKSNSVAGSWYWANPLIVNNVIYAPNIDGKVYVFDAANGQTVKIIDLLQSITSTPILVGNKLIVASEDGKSDGKLWAIDTSSYNAKLIIDLKKLIYAPLSASGNIVYVHTRDNTLYALNADTEVILWTQPVNS